MNDKERDRLQQAISKFLAKVDRKEQKGRAIAEALSRRFNANKDWCWEAVVVFFGLCVALGVFFLNNDVTVEGYDVKKRNMAVISSSTPWMIPHG